MFRRSWAGLPKDAAFPSDLKGLGYFINEDDEIRSIEDPDCYFKFFLNRNTRINDRQRFEFNAAMGKIVSKRLEHEGLEKVNLPLGTGDSDPHVPVFRSPDLREKTHFTIVFGEPTQDLGILAGRVANGSGGLDKGSMVSIVRALKEQTAFSRDESAPGIILANMGQRYWWPDGKRALTIADSAAIPLPSMVHTGRKYISSLNDIPGSETPLRHVETIFNEVVYLSTHRDTMINIVAVGQSCELVEKFLDDAKNWKKWGTRLNAIVLLGNIYTVDKLINKDFKEFLAKRGCSFLISEEPRNTPIASPLGNESLHIEALGTPCYSSGEPWCTELILINGIDLVIGYFKEVAAAPDFENPPIVVIERPPVEEVTEEVWNDVPEDQKPLMSVADQEAIKKQVKEARTWRKLQETGEVPNSDDDDSDVEEVPRDGLRGTWDD